MIGLSGSYQWGEDFRGDRGALIGQVKGQVADLEAIETARG